VRDQLADHGNRVMKPRLFTAEQGAVYLSRTKGAVEHMIACGKFPVVRADRRGDSGWDDVYCG
jgi:lipoate-protein ligase B